MRLAVWLSQIKILPLEWNKGLRLPQKAMDYGYIHQ